MHNVNIIPDLGPEALEAIRSCPAVQFIQAYKDQHDMYKLSLFQATLLINPPDPEKLKDTVLPIIYRR